MTSTNRTSAADAARELNASDITPAIKAVRMTMNQITAARAMSAQVDTSDPYFGRPSEDRYRRITQRRTIARILTASVLAALAITSTATAASTPDRVAPGGNITAVERTVDRLGWPHVPQHSEMTAIARLSLYYGADMFGRAGSTRCHFGTTMGRARCVGKSTTRSGRTVRFTHVFRIWEDGSYRVSLVAPKGA